MTSTLPQSTAWSWTDITCLNQLRLMGDSEADACAAELAAMGQTGGKLRSIFARLRQRDISVLHDAPLPMLKFLADTVAGDRLTSNPHADLHAGRTVDADALAQQVYSLPAWADRERIRRGQIVFRSCTLPSVLVMLCKSLPEGYAAPSMARILNLSGELRARPFHRLMGTLQLLQDVGTPGSFEPGGVGVIVAKEMRLLHAGVRTNVARDAMGEDRYSAFVAQYGLPINQEDMLGTILGFSSLVVDGLRTLNVPFSDADAEDYYYVWRVYGHMAGIRRPGVAENEDAMPPTLDDARAFYAAYKRHYVGAASFAGDWRERSIAANPDGVQLADAHVDMLAKVLPPRVQTLLRDRVPRIYVQDLAGPEACARVGISPVTGHFLLRFGVHTLPRLWRRVMSKMNPTTHVAASEWLFSELIQTAYSRPISYTVPRTVQDLREFVEEAEKRTGYLPQ